MIILNFIINSIMFSYPPAILIRACDNLVSEGQGFASAMHSGAGVGTRVEMSEFLLAAMLWLEFSRRPTAMDPPLQMLLPRLSNPEEQARRVRRLPPT
jgi:hypothetical protein